MTPDNDILKVYLDAEGRVVRWPHGKKNRSHQQLVLEYLASKFEPDQLYTEQQVNAILNRYHTFEDWALLRRELFERGHLNREKDGSAYWRTPQTRLY